MLLSFQPTCDVDIRSNTQHTPFHVAVTCGSFRVIEKLVGFGVDVTAVDLYGDTALHLVVKNNVKPYNVMPNDECPEMKKVSSSC